MPKTKREIAEEIFNNTSITKEQYEQFKLLYEEFELTTPEPEPTWEELLGE